MHCSSTTIFLPRSWVPPTLRTTRVYHGHGLIRDNALLSRRDKIPAAVGTMSAAKSPVRVIPRLSGIVGNKTPPVPSRSFVDVVPVPEDISISEWFRGRWHARGEGGRQQNALTLICPYVGRSQWRGTNSICRRRCLVTLRAALRDVDGERPSAHDAIRCIAYMHRKCEKSFCRAKIVIIISRILNFLH